ncbi:MAG: hypothetical protein Q9195_004622 [Heterodermia aff. obscurata]
MATHPVLKLLAKEEEPPFRVLQKAAALLAGNPGILLDLMGQDLSDDLLALLETKVARFSKMLLELSGHIRNKDEYSLKLTPFVIYLVRSTKDMLDRREYRDLLDAALQLCLANRNRWQIVEEIAAQDGTMELLIVSAERHSNLLQWFLDIEEEGADASVLIDWTQRVVALIDACSSDHHVSAALNNWRKIDSLCQALRKAIDSDADSVQASGKSVSLSSHVKNTVIDHHTSSLFLDFNLAIPQSQGMYRHHLDVLSHRETLLTLKVLLRSFPCGLCQRAGHPDAALLKVTGGVEKAPYEYNNFTNSFTWNVKSLGDWQVVLSSQAYQKFRSLKGSLKTREALSMKLKKLAAGYLNWKILSWSHETPRIPLKIAKGRSNMDFLCQIDLAPGPELNMEQQVIKIWAIGSESTFDAVADEVAKFQKGYSQERVNDCLETGVVFRGKQHPVVYQRLGNARGLQGPTDLDIRLVDQDFIDTFNKSFTITEEMLQSIIDQDLAAEFPFDMSDMELQIIQHSGTPTLIIGRSGTGKTTCLVFRMIHRNFATLRASPESPARQVLITRSETLADKLATYSRRIIRTLSKDSILSRPPDKTQHESQRTLLDLDLDDFPLVCTYDQFLLMLKGAVDSYDPTTSGDESQTNGLANIVDFKSFRHRYWTHFPLELRKNLSVDLVFSEIMGTIKGSSYTCTTLESLDVQKYLELSVRVAPNFPSSNDRSRVFRIFQRYEKIKLESREIDSIDFVVSLIRRLQGDWNMKSRIASSFHEFYVDEVQDLRCIDISLLLTLGKDPRGFHFGRDTAQTISQDSTFRFQDVKAMFHDHFGRQSAAIAQEDLAQPLLFTLDRNYRSHQGILSLASSVMELLFNNFPDTVDKLGPEIGTLVGPTPNLFLGCDSSILRNRASGDSPSPHEVLFGAEQVILTRDEEQKAKLLHSIGESALVLTILQAKGMEFEDVILFNFLYSTPDPVGWRSIRRSTMDPSSLFDAAKHAALCSELKHLYVAITRARIRFIMIEESENNAQPFIDLMTLRSAVPLIENTSIQSPNFPEKIRILQPRTSHDPHRWAAHGEELMARGDYAIASLCFRRATQPLKAKVAEAHLKEVEGLELEAAGEGTASVVKFEEATATFLEMDLVSDATRLLIRLSRLEDAAEVWHQSGQFQKAALLFEEASNHQRASSSWHSNGDYEKAAICLRSGGFHNEMVSYLTKNKGHLDSRSFIRHQRVVKLLLKQQKISLNYRGLAIGLLGSVHEQEAFYLEYEMLESLVELYKDQKLYSKLLNLRVQLGDFQEAFELACSTPCRGESVIGKAQLLRLTSIVWIDLIASTSSHPIKVLMGTEGDQSWQLAFKILRAWDSSSSERVILSLDNDSIKEYLCLYVTIYMERIIHMTKLSDIPYDLFHHALMTIKSQGTEASGPFGAAVLLLCGVHRNFTSSQQYTLRPWSPVRITGSVENGNSLPETALRWTYDKLSGAIMRVNELAREFFRIKWPSRCSFFLVTGFCSPQGKRPACSYDHKPVNGSAPAEFLHDLLIINKVLCQSTTLYNRRVMPEPVSKTFLGARRHWLEKLVAALSFISAFEQDTVVLNESRQKLRTEKSLGAVAAILEDHLFYRVRTEWTTHTSLGYIFEQLDIAAYLGGTVMRSLIRKTSTPLRQRHRLTYAALVGLDRLQAQITSGNPIGFLESLKDFLHGPQGIMKLPWNAFDIFHCHSARFEEMTLYLLLQIAQSSIMVPRSWVDLHLCAILTRNKLVNALDFQQRSIYRDALIILLSAYIRLLHFADLSLQENKKLSLQDNQKSGFQFQLCGREYPARILQQRNCELLMTTMVNLLAVRALCPADIKTRWKDMVQTYELPTVKGSHLNHKVGNENELRKKLFESHCRYHGKNPLVVLTILDGMSQHPFATFQKANRLANENLITLRKAAISKETPGLETHVEATTEASAEQTATDLKAAKRIWVFWQKYSPRLRARKIFANTQHDRLISKLHNLGKSCSRRSRCILFSYGSEVFPLLDSLESLITALKKRALLQLDTAGVESSEALDTVLEAVTELGEALKTHHKRLSDESLHSLIEAEDGDGLKEVLREELGLMGKEKVKIAPLEEILDGMAGD